MKLLASLIFLFLVACETLPQGDSGMAPTPVAVAQPSHRIPLYWENTTAPHPERIPWSDLLTDLISENLELYSSAKDITEICPKYHSLSEALKVKAIGEFWVAVAYHESGFNPETNSVDVGNPGDKGSWSVGLYQMSANDSSCKKYGATFEGLKNPLVNIQCATEQMRKQLVKERLLLLPNSSDMRYWAVILKGNKYSQIPAIKDRVLKYAPSCK